MSELIKSGVVFDKQSHTYWHNGKQLSGVTSLLSRQLFADKYSKIDEARLDVAKERGTLVHEAIEMFDTLGIIECDEVKDYIKIKEKHGLRIIANEFLISDNENIASSIDLVNYDYSIIDTKTTSSLDREYLSWQLSIYAYLLELQNPHIKVPHLYALWLPLKKYGKSKLEEIERKPIEWCKQLIECDARGEQYCPPVKDESQSLKLAEDVIDELVNMERIIKELNDKRKMVLDGLMQQMKGYNVKSFKCDRLSLTYKAPTTRISLDSTKLKEEYPDVYNACIKESITKESILIKTL